MVRVCTATSLVSKLDEIWENTELWTTFNGISALEPMPSRLMNYSIFYWMWFKKSGCRLNKMLVSCQCTQHFTLNQQSYNNWHWLTLLSIIFIWISHFQLWNWKLSVFWKLFFYLSCLSDLWMHSLYFTGYEIKTRHHST